MEVNAEKQLMRGNRNEIDGTVNPAPEDKEAQSRHSRIQLMVTKFS